MKTFVIKPAGELNRDGIRIRLYNYAIKNTTVPGNKETTRGTNGGGESKLINVPWAKFLDVEEIKVPPFGFL